MPLAASCLGSFLEMLPQHSELKEAKTYHTRDSRKEINIVEMKHILDKNYQSCVFGLDVANMGIGMLKTLCLHR